MKKALPLLLSLALAGPSLAQTAPNTLPFRGTMRVRTAVSISGSRQWAQKIFPTLESGLFRIENTRLDWLGLADEGYRLTPDGWLAYRGAAAKFTEARPQLSAIPGFEWFEQAQAGMMPQNLCVYGADHIVPGRNWAPNWPALRVGRLVPDLTEGELRNLYDRSLESMLRRGRLLSLFDDLYHESLGTDLLNTGNVYNQTNVDPGNLPALEKAEFSGTTPVDTSDPYNLPTGSGLPPTESIWGPPSQELKGDLNLDQGVSIAQQLQDPPGLLRMGNTALEVTRLPQAASVYLPILQNRLRYGDPPSNNGWYERLPLVPGWRPDKVPEAARDNPQYQRMYSAYFTLMEAGLNVFQSYGGGLSRSGLENARYNWSRGTGSQHVQDLPPDQQRSWDQMVDWLQQYDDRQPIVAQFTTPAVNPASWLTHLDPRKLKNRPLARERLALLEVVSGQNPGDFASAAPPLGGGGGGGGGAPGPGASPPVVVGGNVAGRLSYDYYNLALRNGWRVVPVSGIDNLGPLNRHQGKLVPQARSTFTGLYAGTNDAIVNTGQANLGSNGPERVRQLLEALGQRRTFVSENPYVDALFYARDVTTGRLTVMGGSLFQGQGGAPTTFELTLELRMPVRHQVTDRVRIRMEDIKLVEVVERERDFDAQGRRVKIWEATRNPQQVQLGAQQLTMLVSDEIPVLRYYTSGAVAQPGTSAGVGSILLNYGLTGQRVNPPEPETYPLPVTLTWRITARPHQPGATVAYYVKANLPEMGQIPAGSVVTAPLWTVSDWARFTSIDEAQ